MLSWAMETHSNQRSLYEAPISTAFAPSSEGMEGQYVVICVGGVKISNLRWGHLDNRACLTVIYREHKAASGSHHGIRSYPAFHVVNEYIRTS